MANLHPLVHITKTQNNTVAHAQVCLSSQYLVKPHRVKHIFVAASFSLFYLGLGVIQNCDSLYLINIEFIDGETFT